MLEVTAGTSGLDLNILSDKITPEIASKLVEKLATLGVFTMYSEAPYRTGKLANSIKKQVNGLSATIGSTVPYALYVENGTSAHIIKAPAGKVLAFQKSGKTIFTPMVKHPGTKPNPFMHRTTQILQEQTPEIFTELMQKQTEK